MVKEKRKKIQEQLERTARAEHVNLWKPREQNVSGGAGVSSLQG